MNNDDKILILNTGGTFNKVYDPISGELDVPKNCDAVNDILKRSYIENTTVEGIIFKDSLDMTDGDRKELCEYIINSSYEKIIIIHGTDTMDKSAEYIAKKVKNKQVVFTGAMIPYSIEKTEAVSNFMGCYGFLQVCEKNGIFIGMHGFIDDHKIIKKNKKLGIFECRK